MKKLQKIIDLLLKVIELLPILIEFLKALDRDTNVIKSKLDSLNIQVEDMKKISDVKQQQVTDSNK